MPDGMYDFHLSSAKVENVSVVDSNNFGTLIVLYQIFDFYALSTTPFEPIRNSFLTI